MGRHKGSKTIHPKSIEERFWSKVNKKSDDECWEWMAFIHPSGYGTFSVMSKPVFAHRMSWMIHFGDIPENKCILHFCDNRICVNPNHLFLGDYADNAHDRDGKKRSKIPDNRGEKHGNHKLIRDDVLKIRRLYSSGKYTLQEIGDYFGINRRHIGRIVRKESWSWLKDDGSA